MTKIKKIAIITTHSFGYVDFVVERIKSFENVDLTYINIDSIPFTYKNFCSRIANFFFKLLHFPSLKDQNRTNFIKKALNSKKTFDQVLIIRPDKIQKEALISIRENTTEMTCFLFDGIENYKAQKDTLHFFDTIYSYDRKDVDKYKFEFLSNYIYDEEIKNEEPTQTVFTISSYDERYPFLEKLGVYLRNKNISFRFIVKTSKKLNSPDIEFSDEYLSISEVKKIIAQSSVLIDIQRKNQFGLSFRVVEALGYRKKLITNNQDVVNYDFYNKNNICVISESNYEIPDEFFETNYIDVSPEILNKYKLNSWISTIFKLN